MKISFLLLLPLVFLIFYIFLGYSFDFVKDIYFYSGIVAICLIFCSIIIRKFKKIFGLFAFFYAILHILNFIILDNNLNLQMAFNEVLTKKYLIFGFASFVILFVLFIISFYKTQKYKFLFKMSYLALILALLHYIFAQKVMLFYHYAILLFVVLFILYRLRSERV